MQKQSKVVNIQVFTLSAENCKNYIKMHTEEEEEEEEKLEEEAE